MKRLIFDEEGRPMGKHAKVIFAYGLNMPKPIDDDDGKHEQLIRFGT